MEYCCHVWAVALRCFLNVLDTLQKRVCATVGPTFAASLEPLVRRRNVASLSFLYKYYFDSCLSKLVEAVPLSYFFGRSTCYFNRLHAFCITVPRFYKDVYVNNFFPQTAKLSNSL